MPGAVAQSTATMDSAERVARMFGDLGGVSARDGEKGAWVLQVYARIFQTVCTDEELQRFEDILTEAGEITDLNHKERTADGKLSEQDRAVYFAVARKLGLNTLAPRLLEIQKAYILFLTSLDDQLNPTEPTAAELDRFFAGLRLELPAIREQVRQKLSGQSN